MPCEALVGVKNTLLTFYDCDTDTTIGPISHKLSSEDLPMWKSCTFTNEALVGGYTKRSAANAEVEIKLIRDVRIPLAFYQGCARVDIQVEYENGLVYTGLNGGVIGDDKSDTHEIDMNLTFKNLDEMLPVGSLADAA